MEKNIDTLLDELRHIRLNLPSISSDRLSYLQELDYLTYAINKCVNAINTLDPDSIAAALDAFKKELAAIQEELNKFLTDDVKAVDLFQVAKLNGLTNGLYPQGSGSKDINIICNGQTVLDPNDMTNTEYDTYNATFSDSLGIWFGVEVDAAYAISQVNYYTGGVWSDGGWFGAEPKIDAYIDGKWVEQESSISGGWPGTMDKPGYTQGHKFEFILAKPIMTTKIRIRGVANAYGKNVSCTELQVLGTADIINAKIANLQAQIEANDADINELQSADKQFSKDIYTLDISMQSLDKEVDALQDSLDHKVSHTNSASIVYATDSTGTDTPIQFTSNAQASTIALRTSTGQISVADATTDNHAVGYKQMKTYVAEHGGSGGGLSLHKIYELKLDTYTITDSEVWDALVTNQGSGCQVMISGTTAYTSGSQPFGIVFSPYYNSNAYNPTWQYECPAHINIGDSNEYLKFVLTYNNTNSSISITAKNVDSSGNAYDHVTMYRIEILKF
jgi:hypothetical protein